MSHRLQKLTSVVCMLAAAGCMTTTEEPLQPKRVARSENAMTLAAGWVEGSGWPSDTVVALKSASLGQDATVLGNLSVITASSGATLGGGPELLLGQSARVRGNVKTDTLQLDGGAQITGNATYNGITSLGVVSGTSTSTLSLPLSITIPTVSNFSANTTDITTDDCDYDTLASGTYRTLSVGSCWDGGRSELHLTGGTYVFSSINIGNQAKVVCDAACEIRVKNNVLVGYYSYFGASFSRLAISDVKLIVEGANSDSADPWSSPAVSFYPGSRVQAYVFAPNGTVVANETVSVVGKVVAHDVALKQEARVLDGSDALSVPEHFVADARWPNETLSSAGDLSLQGSVTGDLLVRDEGTLGEDGEVDGFVVADSWTMATGSHVTTGVMYNTLDNDGTIDGSQDTPVWRSLEPSVPVFPVIGEGTTDVTVDSTDDDTLGSGAYGDLELEDGTTEDTTTLTLTGGIYRFESITMGHRSRVFCAAACELRVKGRVVTSYDVMIAPITGAGLHEQDVKLFVAGDDDGSDAAFYTNAIATLHAFIYVPYGSFQSEGDVADNHVNGKIIAGKITVSAGVTGSASGSDPTIIHEQPKNAFAPIGGTATFTVVATGEHLRYQWQRNDVDIPGANGPTYTTATASLDDDGDLYRCLLMGDQAWVFTEEATLTVTEGEPVLLYSPANVRVAVAGATTLTCDVGGEDLTYVWRRNGITISGATSRTYTIAAATIDDDGRYGCTATNTYGSVTSDEASVWVTTGAWPNAAVVALDSVEITQNAVVGGGVAVLTANAGPMLTGDAELSIGQSALVHGNVSADTLTIASGAHVFGNVSYNSLTSLGAVDGSSTSPADVPIDEDVPHWPSFSPGFTEVYVDSGESLVLGPGSYGNATTQNGIWEGAPTELHLTGGTYNFNDLVLNGSGRLICDDVCEVRVKGRFDVGSDDYVGPAYGAHDISNFEIFVEAANDPEDPGGTPSAFHLGNSRLEAYVFVPNGTAHLDGQAMMVGKLVARYVSIGGAFVLMDGSGVQTVPEKMHTIDTWPLATLSASSSLELDGEVSGDVIAVVEGTLQAGSTVNGHVTGGDLTIASGAHVTGDVHAVALDNDGTIDGSESGISPVDVFVNTPPFPAIPSGTTDIEVDASDHDTLAPGNYDEIELLDGASGDPTRLTLTGGIYNFGSVTLGSYSRLECESACEIRVRGRVSAETEVAIGPSFTAAIQPQDVKLFVAGTDITSGPTAFYTTSHATLDAWIFVPYGTLEADGDAGDNAFTGKIIAQNVLLHANLTGSGSPYEPTVILQQPENNYGLLGETATFRVTAIGRGVEFQWFRNGSDISGANTASYTTDTLDESNNGDVYTVLVMGENGWVWSDEATLTVTEGEPVILKHPASTSAAEGSDVTFTCDAFGAGLDYEWQKNGVTIAGATAASYTIADVDSGDIAQYRCLASNTLGDATSHSASLWVTTGTWPSEALVALNSVWMDQDTVVTGNLSVIKSSPGPVLSDSAELSMDQSAAIYGDVRADTIVLANAGHIAGNAHYNGLTNSFGHIDGTSTSSLATPVDADAPNMPSFASLPGSFTVETGTARTLAAGTYGNIVLNNSSYGVGISELRLSGGTYTFAALTVGVGGRVTCDDACDVRVTGRVYLDYGAYVGPSEEGLAISSVKLFVRAMNGDENDPDDSPSAVFVNDQSHIDGYIFAPNGTVWLGNEVMVIGKVVARDVSMGWRASVADGSDAVATAPGLRLIGRWPNAVLSATNDLSVEGSVFGDILVTRDGLLGEDSNIYGSFIADTWDMATGSHVYGNAMYNSLDNDGTIDGNLDSPVWTPEMLIPNAPTFPIITPGTTPVTIDGGDEDTLAAGHYTALELEAGTSSDRTVLTLTGGVYHFSSVLLREYTSLFCSAACEIRITGRFQAEDSTQVGPSPELDAEAKLMKIFVAGEDVSSGPTAFYTSAIADLSAWIFIPHGSLRADGAIEDNQVHGKILAQNITIRGATSGSGSTYEATVIHTEPADVTVETGHTATFSVVATGEHIQFQWQKNGDDIPDANGASYTTDELDLGNDGDLYRCNVMGDGGWITTREALLTVTEQLAPEITTNPSNSTVTEFSPASFTCAASGNGVTYQWQKGTTDISGATSATYNISSTALSDAGTYRCVATNTVGSDTSSSATLTVNMATPTFTTPPADTQVNAGDALTLHCDAHGSSLSYVWKKGGTTISGATSATYTVGTSGASDIGTYQCVVSNTAGTITSSTVTVTVILTPPTITTQPSDVSVDVGDPFTFTVVASGEVLSYQWQRFGASVPSGNTASYSKLHAAFSDDGATYRVIVSNSGGSVTSTLVTLHVDDGAGPNLIVDDVTTPTTAAFVTLTGTVTDAGAGVASVHVTSTRYTSQTFGTLIDGAGTFSGEVPLKVGSNVLTVTATDHNDNTTTHELTIVRSAPLLPQIVITSPANASTALVNHVDVEGKVISSLDAKDIKLTLGNAVIYPTGDGPEYSFEFENVHLVQGANLITVLAETTHGNVTKDLTVNYKLTGTSAPEPAPPVIALQVTAPDVYFSGSSIPVAGTVTASRCVSSVTVNSSAATLTGGGTIAAFSKTLSFGSSTDVTVNVMATDCDGLTASASYTAHKDVTAPVIALNGGLSISPAVNDVAVGPYILSGTITDANLAGLVANNQSIGALPTGTPGEWTFEIGVPLVHQSNTTVVLEAWDASGLHATTTVVLRLNSSYQIGILAPNPGATYIATSTSVPVEVVARATGIANTDALYVSVDSGTASEMNRQGEAASLDVFLAPTTGDHVLTVVAKNAAGSVLATSNLTVHVLNGENIATAVVAQEPENESSNIEANTPIVVHFNKAIDPSKLQFAVVQTVHGKLWKPQPSGIDITKQSELELVEMNLERAPVLGNAVNFPGNQMFAFYPSADYGYGGTVLVDLTYDGEALWHSQFSVRALPNLVQGFIADQFATPLAGVRIEIPELQRTVVTDNDGAWQLGYGETAAAMAPAGRYRAIVNPDSANPSYGTVERWISVQPGLTMAGATLLPILSAAESTKSLASRASTPVPLAGGEISLDVSDADLTFPSGMNEGAVRAQFLSLPQLSYKPSGPQVPAWAYVVTPAKILVSGEVGVRIQLPKKGDSFAYVDELPERVVLVGLDDRSLQLVAVGVCQVDKDAHELTSEGHVALNRLDYFAFFVPGPDDQALLQRFANDEIDINALRAALEKE